MVLGPALFAAAPFCSNKHLIPLTPSPFRALYSRQYSHKHHHSQPLTCPDACVLAVPFPPSLPLPGFLGRQASLCCQAVLKAKLRHKITPFGSTYHRKILARVVFGYVRRYVHVQKSLDLLHQPVILEGLPRVNVMTFR